MVDQILLQEPGQEEALTMRKLHEAVLRLPRLRREALILIVAHGLSYEQVAAICGCAVGTIKSRVARAREQLYAAVDGEKGQANGREPRARPSKCFDDKGATAVTTRNNTDTDNEASAAPTKVVSLTDCRSRGLC
jgi:hypothetical protein